MNDGGRYSFQPPNVSRSTRPHGPFISADYSDYCRARGCTVTATFIDTAGARDDSTLDYIVVWKLHRFSRSLEETIELRDKLRRVGTRLVSAREKGVDD